jgi:integrase
MPRTTSRPPLSDARIEKLQPRDARYEIADPGCAGLRLRVLPTGLRVFRWYCTSAGKVVTIGTWAREPTPGHVTLTEARVRLHELKAAHHAGELVGKLAGRRVRAPQARDGEGAAPDSFAALAREFLAHAETKLQWRSIDEVRRTVERDLVAVLGARPVKAVTSREVATVIEAIAERAPATASAVFGHARAIFRYGQGRGLVATNPVAGLSRHDLGAGQGERSRILSDIEIGQFWHALDRRLTVGSRAGLRLLLLTGVRSAELLGARWDEIDFEAATWTVPPERIKAKPGKRLHLRPRVVPLAPQAITQFRKLEALAEGSPFVFVSLATESGCLHDRALGASMRKIFRGPDALKLAEPKPTPHDLRRTFRSGLSDLKVPWHVAERCLGHSLGKVPDTYDRADYLAERRAALAAWAQHVEQLVTREPAQPKGSKQRAT